MLGQVLIKIQTFWRNSHPEVLLWSDLGPFYDRRRAQRWFGTFEIKKWIYVHSGLTTWLQEWSAEYTSIAECLCSVMLTADCSWRGNVLYFMNVTLQRGEGKKKRKCWVHSEVGVQWVRWELSYSLHTLIRLFGANKGLLHWWYTNYYTTIIADVKLGIK